jgi:hypothetical protein
MKNYILNKYLLLLLLVLSGSGCEKYINYVNSPEFEQKLVVTSFISPSDTMSEIFVSSNQRLYGYYDKLEDPGDIMGTISDGTTEVELDTTSSGLSFSRDKMPVISGKTYTLKISSSKGLYAEAVTTIPQKREMMIKMDTVTVTQDVPGYESSGFLGISVEFTDYPGEKNYYNLIGKITVFRTTPSHETAFYYNRFWFEYINDMKAGPDNKITIDTWMIPSINSSDSAFINVSLLNIEESYYLYHTSLYEFDRSDNPFSEAKPVYSNIKGGLGIFTSYTLDSLRFRLR